MSKKLIFLKIYTFLFVFIIKSSDNLMETKEEFEENKFQNYDTPEDKEIKEILNNYNEFNQIKIFFLNKSSDNVDTESQSFGNYAKVNVISKHIISELFVNLTLIKFECKKDICINLINILKFTNFNDLNLPENYVALDNNSDKILEVEVSLNNDEQTSVKDIILPDSSIILKKNCNLNISIAGYPESKAYILNLQNSMFITVDFSYNMSYEIPNNRSPFFIV